MTPLRPSSGGAEVDAPKMGYARSRSRSFALTFALAVAATAGAPAPVDRTREGVASILGKQIAGTVAPADFVWEPSRGWALDAIVGRRVVFLGQRNGARNRQLYRGLVALTPEGRPIAVRAVAPISGLDLADATDLKVSGAALAMRLDSEVHDGGESQGIEVLTLDPPSTNARALLFDWLSPFAPKLLSRVRSAKQLVFAQPEAPPRFELQGTDLVVAFRDGASAMMGGDGAVTWSGDALRAPFAIEIDPRRSAEAKSPWAELWRGVREVAGFTTPAASEARVANRLAAPEIAAPNALPTFPPPSFAPVDATPGAFTRTLEGVSMIALDMRRFTPELVVGSGAALTRTGHVGSGRMRARRGVEAVFRVPTSELAGAWDAGTLIAPLSADRDTVAQADAGTVPGGSPARRFAFGDAAPDAPPFAVQWAPERDDEARPRAALCVTESGHWVLAWAASATASALTHVVGDLMCSYRTPSGAPLDAKVGGSWINPSGAPTPWAGSDALDVNALEGAPADLASATLASASYLYFTRVKTEPTVAAPAGDDWSALAIQPEPPSIPAIYETTVDSLGESVHVRLFQPHRFDWAIRAGDEEKQHRFGGTFERALDAADTSRVYFSTGLGVAKRQDPLGLRIAGSTGHRFHDGAGLIEATADGLRIRASNGAEPTGDASEVLVSVRDGALTTDAHERGPRQARADACVLSDGTALFADAVFDNHEATAKVLVDLGCTFVVALDRGVARAAWASDRDADPVDERATTALFALARPLPGPYATQP